MRSIRWSGAAIACVAILGCGRGEEPSPVGMIKSAADGVAPSHSGVTANQTIAEGATIVFAGTVTEQNAAPNDDGIEQVFWDYDVGNVGAVSLDTEVVCDDGLGGSNECTPLANDLDAAGRTIDAATGTAIRYGDDGTYTARLQSEDEDAPADVTQSDITITVTNVDPTITIVSDNPEPSGEAGLVTVRFDLSDPGTRADEVDRIVVDWGDGSLPETLCDEPAVPCPDDGTNLLGPTHTYADDAEDVCDSQDGVEDGLCVITLTAFDDQGADGIDTEMHEVNNVAPSGLNVVSDNDPAEENDLVTFTGTFSDVGTLDTHECAWDFGDGTTLPFAPCTSGAGGAVVSHRYLDDDGDDQYTVVFSVRDDDNGLTTFNYTQAVTNLAPVITSLVSNLDPVDEGSGVTFTVMFTDTGSNDTFSCLFDYGDGDTDLVTPCVSGATSPAHQYAVPNDGDDDTLTVEVTVTDDDGGADDTPTTSQTVQDVDPAVTYLASEGGVDEGVPVVFTANVVSGAPGFDDIDFCEWDTGDLSDPNNPYVFFAGDPECGGSGVVGTNSTFTATYPDSGDYTASLTVFDEDSSDSEAILVSIVNTPPTVTIDETPLVINEGDAVSFSGTWTDPANDLDEPYTCTFDFGDGAGPEPADECVWQAASDTGGAVSFTHTFTDDSEDLCDSVDGNGDGFCTITLAVTDKDGDPGSDSYLLDVNNLPPSFVDILWTGQVAEGQAASVQVVGASDPGDDEFFYTFDWNANGVCDLEDVCDSTLSGSSYVFPDESSTQPGGVYTIRVELCDDDGACVEDFRDVLVTDAQPVIVTFTNSAPKGEAELVSASVEMNVAEGDSYTIAWTWGGVVDPSCADARVCQHAFGDNGTYSLQVDVTDDEGNVATQSTTVSISNRAPTALADSGCGTAANGAAGSYVCDVGGTDPAGAADPLAFALVTGPAGMSVNAGTGVVSWTPTGDQSRSTQSFQVKVSDGDGGEAYFDRTVVSYLDSDSDGLPDVWEDQYGTDKNTDDDAADGDNDGLTNAEEFAGGTDPGTFDGPDRPIAISPVDAEEAADTTPVLRFRNAVDPQGDTLTYEIQVFDDIGLTNLVAGTASTAQGSVSLGADGGTATDWTVTTALADDQQHWWRVRAHDGSAPGAWSPVESFFVNTANDDPTGIALSAPAAGSHTGLQPVLEVGNATDSDRDALTYVFEVADDGGFTNIVATSPSIPEGDSGTTSWIVGTPLADNTLHYWRATASDGEGGSVTLASQTFFVSSSNDPPSTLVLNGPALDEEVTDRTPDLRVANGTDPDGDALEYEFQIDVTPSFTAPVGGTVAEAANETVFTPASDLADNTRHWWRVRATDGLSAGDWATGTFFVNTANDAPGTPTLQSPTSGMSVDRDALVLSLRNTTDVDGDGLTYTFEIWKDEEATDLHEAIEDVEPGPDGETVVTPTVELKKGKTYWWTATAVDEHGLAGDPSAPAQFETQGGGGGGGGGCGCSLSRSGSPALGSALLTAAGLLALILRRRRT